MANKPVDPVYEKTKKRIRGEIDGVNLTADYITGVKTPDGKVFKDASKKKKDKRIDIDNFLRVAENGFTTITPEKNDRPFNGTLGNVKIERLTKGDGKH